jgi:predicted transposase/invertase (TIGR01784 family)
MMEIIEVAESFFKAHLNPKISAALDWSTLRIAESARSTEDKDTTYTDITYVCYTRDEGIPVYLHVEQERKSDPYMVDRVMQYNLGLINQHRSQYPKDKKLPIIINFVLYNGKKPKKYTYHKKMSTYFSIPWMAELVMGNFFNLINLNEEAVLTLIKAGPGGVMKLLLKTGGDSNFTTGFKEQGVIKDLKSRKILNLSLNYVLAVGKEDPEKIINIFAELYPDFKETIMTAARQLELKGELRGEKRGELRGEKRGMQQEKLEIAKNMLLKLGLDIDTVQKATDLTKEKIQELFKDVKHK